MKKITITEKFYGLSLLGGGVRGRLTIQPLQFLEEKSGKPIAEMFDMIAGTSTGGILACGLATTKYTAQDLAGIYDDHAEEIFTRTAKWKSLFGILRSKHNSTGLERVMNQYFGNSRLSDCGTDILVTAYDTTSAKPYFFKSANFSENQNHFLRDVAVATASAPTYLPPKSLNNGRVSLIDGGIYANDPTMCLLAEALNQGYAPENIFILTIGTGKTNKVYPYREVREWGLKSWLRKRGDTPLISMIMDGTNETVDYQTRQILSPENYLHLQIEIAEKHSVMDNATAENMKALSDYGKEMTENYAEDLGKFLSLIS